MKVSEFCKPVERQRDLLRKGRLGSSYRAARREQAKALYRMVKHGKGMFVPPSNAGDWRKPLVKGV